MRSSAVFSLMVFALLACGDDDVATDAGPSDAASDTILGCTDDLQCDDGLFCTGVETCSEGVCRQGTRVVCDDEIACTIDACNEVTNRCEGLAPDRDEDGAGDSSCLDPDGEPLGRDCDDADPLRFGGNREVCDEENIDEDCDPRTFGQVDNDDDGYFDARCQNTAGDGTVARGEDCDDGRRDVNPASTEVCDHVDNNCDGSVDEGVVVEVAPDADRDGFPANEPMMECPGFAGQVAIDADTLFDCDDDNARRNPGQVEICDMADNDCDDNIDEAAQSVPWYADRDGDGFGAEASGVVESCSPVMGASLLNTDCDDDAAGRNPAAAELCNGEDDDCNGRADFEIAAGDFEDDDGDGRADIGCGLPWGVDCDDRDVYTAGGATETCDGRDNDCDGRVDENADALQWFYDGDADGHGTLSDPVNPPVLACSAPAHYVGSGGDCDDADPLRFPGADESCGRVDDDCDGAVDEGLASCDCPDGFATCEGAPPPGCHTNIWNDLRNCGACGQVCGDDNTDLAMCNRGDCFLECSDGFSDCDGGGSNGCETAGPCPARLLGHLTWGDEGSDLPSEGAGVEVAAGDAGELFVAANVRGPLRLGTERYGFGGDGAVVFQITSSDEFGWALPFSAGPDGHVQINRILWHHSGGQVVVGTAFGTSLVVGGRAGVPIRAQGTAFVTRIDDGDVTWTRTISSGFRSQGEGVAFDLAENVVVTGAFTGALGAGVVSTGGLDGFVVTLRPTDGIITGRRRFGGVNDEVGMDLVVGDGGTFVVGHFTTSTTIVGVDLSGPVGVRHAFYTNFDGFSLAIATASDEILTDIEAPDADQGLVFYMAGTFAGSTTFNGSTYTADRGLIVAQIGADGSSDWSFGMNGGELHFPTRARLTVDFDEIRVLISSGGGGSIEGFPLLGSGPRVLRIEASDGILTAVESFPQRGVLRATDIALAGSLPVVVGYFDRSMVIDGVEFTTAGLEDQFVMRLNR